MTNREDKASTPHSQSAECGRNSVDDESQKELRKKSRVSSYHRHDSALQHEHKSYRIDKASLGEGLPAPLLIQRWLQEKVKDGPFLAFEMIDSDVAIPNANYKGCNWKNSASVDVEAQSE